MAKFKVGARQLQTKRQAKDTASQIGLVWPCGAYRPKIVTNADRIRSMTDEEAEKKGGTSLQFKPREGRGEGE